MAENDTSKQTKAKDDLAAVVRQLRKDVDDLLARDARHSLNWKRAVAAFMDAGSNGEIK